MNTHEKGLTGELKVVLRAQEKGWKVSKPFAECRYDLVLDDGKKLYRAQVKYADHERRNAVEVPVRSECRNNGYKRCYEKNEIDVILVYVPKVDKIAWLDLKHFEKQKATVSLRLKPPKNGQTKGILMVDDVVW